MINKLAEAMGIRILRVLFLATLGSVLVLGGCAGPSANQSGAPSDVPYEVALSDSSFSALDGNIKIHNLKVKIDGALVDDKLAVSPRDINATVRNETDATLNTITFDVLLKSKRGRTLASQPVSVTDPVGPGASATLDYALAGGIYGEVEYSKEMSFALGLRNIKYDAQYTFELNNSNNLTFENDSLRINFEPTKEEIGFRLKNKTDQSVQIIWDRTSYIDIEGSSHSVIKGGTRYSERNKSIKPTSVAPNSFIEELVYPSDYIGYDSYSNEYTKKDLFPNGEESKKYEGQTFSIYMPVSIGGNESSLNFQFKITDVSY